MLSTKQMLIVTCFWTNKHFNSSEYYLMNKTFLNIMLRFGFPLIILITAELLIYNKIASDDIQLEKPDGLVLLNEENFERRIYQGGVSKAGFDYFVKFYALGSPINMDSDWNKLAQKFRNSRDVKIAEFECKAEQRSRFCGDRNIPIGKKHALKKYDQFALNTSCFWESRIISRNFCYKNNE